MTSYQDITRTTSAQLASLRADIPDTMRGFSAMAQAATKDGALDKTTKELIAMALSVAARCDPCVGYHAKALVELGASRAQVAEALGMMPSSRKMWPLVTRPKPSRGPWTRTGTPKRLRRSASSGVRLASLRAPL